MPNSTLSAIARDCATLSSGTLATLSGRRTYAELDTIRDELTTFADGKRFDTWQDAWFAFIQDRPEYRRNECR
jgi:hypothetical protein